MRFAPLLSILLAAAVPIPAQTMQQSPEFEARQTDPTRHGKPKRAVIVSLDGGSFIVGTAELGGLEIYEMSGRRTTSVAAGEAVGIDVRYDAIELAGRRSALIVAADAEAPALRFFAPVKDTLEDVSAAPVPLAFAVEGVCLYHSPEDGSLYAFAVGDGGEVDQLLLFEASPGQVSARQVRRLNVPSTSEHCIVDDRSGHLYVAEEAVGIWRFTAEPETDVAPTLIDAVRLGQIDEEVAGLALYDGGPGARWLMASNTSAAQLLVYDHDKDDAFVGEVGIGAGNAAVESPGGLFATSRPVAGVPGGIVIAADEEATGGADYKLFDFQQLAEALKISVGTPQSPVVPISPTFPTVRATVETEPVAHSGDAADDPAIWANPADPAASLVIGTDKKGGLHVYDMGGKSLQFVPDGKMNNVDLRDGFRLAGEQVTLVTASDRTNKAVAIYRLDSANRRLVNVADGVQPSGLSDPYGQCMYRSPKTGKYYVFVSDPDGLVRQWELVATRDGKVSIRRARDLKFGSQTEGCVADDSTGTLYVGEEDVALWSVTAEPVRSATPKAVDRIESNAKLKDDLEGVGIYNLGNGRGYIVASSQGNNSYAVYRREGDQAYLGSFAITADAAKGIDGVSETDGLDVSSANLGPGFEHGALVAQDGRNVLPAENQNFKIVPWQVIADALHLEVRR